MPHARSHTRAGTRPPRKPCLHPCSQVRSAASQQAAPCSHVLCALLSPSRPGLEFLLSTKRFHRLGTLPALRGADKRRQLWSKARFLHESQESGPSSSSRWGSDTELAPEPAPTLCRPHAARGAKVGPAARHSPVPKPGGAASLASSNCFAACRFGLRYLQAAGKKHPSAFSSH